MKVETILKRSRNWPSRNFTSLGDSITYIGNHCAKGEVSGERLSTGARGGHKWSVGGCWEG